MTVVALRTVAERAAVETPTGLERITRLEIKQENVEKQLAELNGKVAAIYDLLIKGRGAVWFLQWMLWAFGSLGLGYAFRDKLLDFLRWAGS